MSTAKIVIYLTRWCAYCARAKSLLEEKGVPFEAIDVEARPEARAEMLAKSGRRTVPQIFIGDVPLGGCEDLMAREADGTLDSLINPRITS